MPNPYLKRIPSGDKGAIHISLGYSTIQKTESVTLRIGYES